MPRHEEPEITVSQLRTALFNVLKDEKGRKGTASGLKKKIRAKTATIIPGRVWSQAIELEEKAGRISRAGGRIFLNS